MPKPIICLADTLCQYLDCYQPCFSPYAWRYFVTVLLAMVECEARASLSAWQRSCADRVSLCGLSRFFSTMCWSSGDLAAIWFNRFCSRLAEAILCANLSLAQVSDPPSEADLASVTGYLIFDDSVQLKPKARKMQSLGQHHSNCEKRVVNGHCLFLGLYLVQDQRCPLQAQLYRQKRDFADQSEFRSKVQLACQSVADFTPIAGSRTHVLVDCWYFNQQLYQLVEQRGWQISGGLKSNRRIKVDGRWVNLKHYAQTLSPAAWQPVHWRNPDQQKWQAHELVTAVSKLGWLKVVVVRPFGDAEVSHYRYYASTCCGAQLQELIEVLAKRWEVEVLFENLKDLLGADSYQLMSREAIMRYWTMLLCFGVYLEEQRVQREAGAGRHLSWGEVRRQIQGEQRDKLLAWLEEQFKQGVTVPQLRLRLAA